MQAETVTFVMIFQISEPPFMVQFWCKQRAHYGNYAHIALLVQLFPSKNELYAHYAHYVQEGCIISNHPRKTMPQTQPFNSLGACFR